MKKGTSPVRVLVIILSLLFMVGTAHFAAPGQTKTRVGTTTVRRTAGVKRGRTATRVGMPTVGKVTAIKRGPTAHKPHHSGNRLKSRIMHGSKDGSLTNRETTRLTKKVAKVKNEHRKAKSDGVITREERRKHKALKREASESIYILRHNRRRKIGPGKKTKH